MEAAGFGKAIKSDPLWLFFKAFSNLFNYFLPKEKQDRASDAAHLYY